MTWQWLLRQKGARYAALVCLLALFGTTITFLLIALFAPDKSYVHALFFERGPIQYITTYCFWIIVVMLGIKHVAFLNEIEAYTKAGEIIRKLGEGVTLIWSDVHRVRQNFTDESLKNHQTSAVFERIINGLDRLRKTKSTKAFEDYFRTRSNIDYDELESSYAGIRYFAWLIPTLGFIGTVLGIGIGIKGFADIIANAQDFKVVQKYLPTVTSYLGTAFDTTLLALGLSAVAVFYLSFLLKRQEQLLGEIDNLCFDGVCPLFQEHSGTSEEIIKAFGDNVDQIRKSMAGNRAAIEQVIRQEFPALLVDELTPQFQSLAGYLGQIAEYAGRLVQSRGNVAVPAEAPQAPPVPDSQKKEQVEEVAGATELAKILQDLQKIMERNNQLIEEIMEGRRNHSQDDPSQTL